LEQLTSISAGTVHRWLFQKTFGQSFEGSNFPVDDQGNPIPPKVRSSTLEAMKVGASHFMPENSAHWSNNHGGNNGPTGNPTRSDCVKKLVAAVKLLGYWKFEDWESKAMPNDLSRAWNS
jgi:hypothetical protein